MTVVPFELCTGPVGNPDPRVFEVTIYVMWWVGWRISKRRKDQPWPDKDTVGPTQSRIKKGSSVNLIWRYRIFGQTGSAGRTCQGHVGHMRRVFFITFMENYILYSRNLLPFPKRQRIWYFSKWNYI